MIHYLALIWDPSHPNQVERARAIASRIESTLPDLSPVTTSPRMAVWCELKNCRSSVVRKLAAGCGVVIGRIFPGGSRLGESLPDSCFGAEDSSRILRSGGRDLIDNYWGHYVAFTTDELQRRASVLREPTGGLKCYYAEVSGIVIVFSSFSDYEMLGLQEFSINWQFVVARTIQRFPHARNSALNEVRVLKAGECLEYDESDSPVVHNYWDAPEVAERSPIESFDDAVEQARWTIQRSVDAWTTGESHITLMFSGGLDSCVVLSALARSASNPAITCVCFYEPPASSEEAEYLQRAVAHLRSNTQARCELIHCEFGDLTRPSWRSAHDGRHYAEPPTYSDEFLHANAALEIARERRGMLMDGLWGDQVFFSYHGHTADDYVWREGFGAELPRIIAGAAKAEMKSGWQVLAAALRKQRGRAMSRPTGVLPDVTFLKPEALQLLDGTAEEYLTPEVLRSDAPPMPPGKRKHASWLRLFDRKLELAERIDDPYRVSPINSQPINELFLRIPTYRLNQGGLNRAVIRRAFETDLEREHLQDGATTLEYHRFTDHMSEMVNRHEKIFKELLLEGRLAAQGLLDQEQLERYFLNVNDPWSQRHVYLLPNLIDIEIWLRTWADIRASKRAAG